MSDLEEHLAAMFWYAPNNWWRFVPCRTCNARRQEPCQAPGGLAPSPHVWRVRSGQMLHATLWLLANHPEDVLGKEGS